MKFKRNPKSLKQKEFTEKYLKGSVKNETIKIDVDSLDASNDEIKYLYERLSKLPTQDLIYKIENEKLTSNEKKILKRILNERK